MLVGLVFYCLLTVIIDEQAAWKVSDFLLMVEAVRIKSNAKTETKVSLLVQKPFQREEPFSCLCRFVSERSIGANVVHTMVVVLSFAHSDPGLATRVGVSVRIVSPRRVFLRWAIDRNFFCRAEGRAGWRRASEPLHPI